MNIHIRSAASISPQNTFDQASFLGSPVEHTGTRLRSIEPDYRDLLDAKLLRRMSRIIRMGTAAASACVSASGEKEPDAIITGTAYGCLEDTGLFLTSLIKRKEESLQPGPFIQSTHNTVGAQIALSLQCTRYNNTFVHRGLSFESALLDAFMMFKEGQVTNVLVGSADETTDTSYAILSRFGMYRSSPISNLSLFDSPSKGTIAGEGAAFFWLSTQSSPGDYAKLEAFSTFYKPQGLREIEWKVRSFLAASEIDPDTIDLVITGRNGDQEGDRLYQQIEASVFPGRQILSYKHLCGEYPTSTSFALWVAANIIRTGTVPPVLGSLAASPARVGRILIYNHYLTVHHSLILLSSEPNAAE